MDDLKPCPFCGSSGVVEKEISFYGHESWESYCASARCPMEDVWAYGFTTEEEAITAWNTRST